MDPGSLGKILSMGETRPDSTKAALADARGWTCLGRLVKRQEGGGGGWGKGF